MINQKAIFFFLLLFSCAVSFCQPQIIWQQEIERGAFFNPSGIAQNTQGGYMICGSEFQSYDSLSQTTSFMNTYVCLNGAGKKTSSKGIAAFGGSEELKYIVPLPSGGYLVAGTIAGRKGGKNISLKKVSANGSVDWEKYYGDKFENAAGHLLLTKSGDIVITGYCARKDDDRKIMVLKLNSNGDIIWNKQFGDHACTGAAAAELGDKLIIGANIDYFDNKSKDSHYIENVVVLALDQNGTITWWKMFDKFVHTYVNALIVTRSNDILASGFVYKAKDGDMDAWTIKLDSKGETQWEQTSHDFWSSYDATGIVELDSSYIICTELAASNGNGFGLLQYNTAGKLIWSKLFDEDMDEKPCAIIPTGDTGFAVLVKRCDSCMSESDNGDGNKYKIFLNKFSGSLEKAVAYYVNPKLKAWEEKGEFEKTEDYKKRISEENRKQIIAKHTSEAITNYAQQSIDLSKAVLSNYMADKEMFGIAYNGADGWVLIKVPLADAQKFKDDWKNVSFENVSFLYNKGKFELDKAVMVVGEKEYTYNSPSPFFSYTKERKKAEEDLYRGSGDPLKGLNVSKSKTPLTTGKYYALIIGIDNYKGQWPELKNAVHDAQAVELLLKSKYKFDNFKTIYDEQATRENIINAMVWLVENTGENDNVFIYYSGHGEFNKALNKGYWVPADAQITSVARYISNSDLQTFLNGIKAKHTLMVSDACFSGDIFRGNTLRLNLEPSSEKYYTETYNLRSRQALTSGGLEPVMDGGKDGHSIFAYYFLNALKGNENPYMDASQLFDKLKIPVTNNSEQTPALQPVKDTGDEGGQFIFIKK